MRTALLMVDAQNTFFDGVETPPVFEAARVLDRLSDLLARARAAGVLVCFVQHCEPEGPFAPGTTSWALHPALAPRPGEPVIEKTAPDSFLATGLLPVLQQAGVGRLVVGGNQTEFCIDTTCRRAQSLGFRVTLASDAHGTWDSPVLAAPQIVAHHNQVLGTGFATVLPGNAIGFD